MGCGATSTLMEVDGVNRTKSKRQLIGRGVCLAAGQCILPHKAYALRTDYVETARFTNFSNASQVDFLGVVMYGQNTGQPPDPGGCPVIALDLPQLNEPPMAEVWTSTLPVAYHQVEGIHFAMNDEVLFGSLQLEEHPDTPVDIITYTGYRRLLLQIRALGYPHLLRVWNYFPRINLESDGFERYQRFCVGRHRALAEGLLDFPRALPAGTAIGTASGPLTIYFLAARKSAMHIENPRQMNAYEYPPVYGPCSPSFARATLKTSFTGGPHLFLSGTASVVGHASQHIGEPHCQTRQILHNLTTLTRHTEQLHGFTCGQMDRQALLKVYIRHPEHLSAIADILKQELPDRTQILYLQGDICRRELLVEVEGILSHPGHDHTLGAAALSVSDPRPAISQHEQPDSLTRA
jgi:chorismate lyase / 3-hydroxybenzoate synthase